jgi:hypothetical protein
MACGGTRIGGRPKGGRNKATIERLKVAERITAEASMVGRTLAKEVLDEFMALFAAAARSYCPTELLILGDWGLATLTQDQGRDHLEIVDDRHNRGSTIVPSQLLCGAPRNSCNALNIVMH